MKLGKGLTRFGLVAAVAAMILTMSLALTQVADAQTTPPHALFGRGLNPGDRIEAYIGGKICQSTVVDNHGEWRILIRSSDYCSPKKGDAVTFQVNGYRAVLALNVIWQEGGLPPDVANGYAIRVIPWWSDPTSDMLILALAVLALGTVAGARVYAGRGR